jgi:hypothetical protein
MARRDAERLQTDLYDDVHKMVSDLVAEGKKKGISKTDVINNVLKIGCERILAGNAVVTLEKVTEDISELKIATSQKIETLEKLMSKTHEEIKGQNAEINASLKEIVDIFMNRAVSK